MFSGKSFRYSKPVFTSQEIKSFGRTASRVVKSISPSISVSQARSSFEKSKQVGGTSTESRLSTFVGRPSVSSPDAKARKSIPDFPAIEIEDKKEINKKDFTEELLEEEDILADLDEEKMEAEEKKNLKIKTTTQFQTMTGEKSKAVLSVADEQFFDDQRFREEFIKTRLKMSWKTANAKTGVDDNNNVRLVSLFSVNARTFRSYASHWSVISKQGFAPGQVRGGKTWSEGLVKYLAANLSRHGNASLSNWTAACNLLDDIVGANGPKNVTKRLVAGYRNLNANGKSHERGVITRGKLEDLCNHPAVKDTVYEDGYRVQFAIGVRTGQMSSVHARDFSPHYDKKGRLLGYIYTCPKHKDKLQSQRDAFENHICEYASNALLTRVIQEAMATRGGHLFKAWDEKIALAKIKVAAVDFGWNPNLQWCNHGIRHGAVLDAADCAQDQSVAGRRKAAQDRTQQDSDMVLDKHYLRSEKDRELVANARVRMNAEKTRSCEIDGHKFKIVKGEVQIDGKKPCKMHVGEGKNVHANLNLSLGARAAITRKAALNKKGSKKPSNTSTAEQAKKLVAQRKKGKKELASKPIKK